VLHLFKQIYDETQIMTKHK